MIGKILFPVMLIVVVILGGVGADFLRSNSGGDDTSHASAKDDHGKPSKKAKDDHGKKDDGHSKKKKKKKKKKGGHGDEDAGTSSGAMSYLTFKRQFVVPVVKKGKIESLVLLNLNLELNEAAPEDVHSFEPKLRDAIMRSLLSLSHNGAFTGDLTNTETYDQIRDNLLSSVKHVITNGIESVLILDISRQDQ